MNASVYGSFLKDARIKAGLTQMQVAHALGYTTGQYISNVERGLCTVTMGAIETLIQLYKLDRAEVFQALVAQKKAEVRKALGMDSRRVSRKGRGVA